MGRATGVGMAMIERRTFLRPGQVIGSRPCRRGPATSFCRRLRTVGILTVLLLQVQSGAAWAEAVTLTRPFAESSTFQKCEGPVCSADATADHATGELSFDVAAAPAGSDLNMRASADASGSIVGTHTLEAESNAIDYSVNVHITELLAERSASARLVAYANHSTCAECDDSSFAYWGGPTPTAVSGEDVSLALKLRNQAGGPIPQGTIRILVTFAGSADAGCIIIFGRPSCWQGAASGRATLTSVEASWNNNPVAANDSASSRAGFPVRINVLANDSDRDGDPLTVTEVFDPPNGSAVINADNTVTYDPDGCFVGTDSFAYTISDGRDASGTGSVAVLLRKASRRSSIGC